MTKTMGRAATLMLLVAGIATGSVALATEAAPAGVTEPTVIGKFQVAPTYPPAAQMARFTGAVTVAAAVDAEGLVSEVEVVESDHPNLGFEDAALEAVRQWKFRPARIGEEAVESVTFVRLEFRTQGSRRSAGYVTGGLVASSIGGPAIGGVGKMDRPVSGDRPTAQDSGTRFQNVNLPGAGLGELYDRTKLVPQPSVLVGNPVPYAGSVSPN